MNFIHNFRFKRPSGSHQPWILITISKIDSGWLGFNPQENQFCQIWTANPTQNSLQARIELWAEEVWCKRLAYRWLDVELIYHGNLVGKPFCSKNRAFINLAYSNNLTTGNLISTTQWLNKKEFQNTSSKFVGSNSIEPYHHPIFRWLHPDYQNNSTKVGYLRRQWKFDTDFNNKVPFWMQLNLSANYFDGPMGVGPISGRNVI